MSADVIARLVYARQVVRRQIAKARAAVIAEQLAAMRASRP